MTATITAQHFKKKKVDDFVFNIDLKIHLL